MIVKWGVIGCGDIAQRMGIPAICQASRSELVAVVDRNPMRAQDLARQYGVRHYSSIEGLLNDDTVNAVYIATPPSLHSHQTILCANAGKHVLCEKSMATNACECANMIQACAKNRVKLMVAYYRRFYPKIQKAKALLDNGVIGKIVFARVQMTMYYNPSNPMNEMEWRTKKEVGGGGCLVDLGSHRLDLLTYLLGNATRITALTDHVICDYMVEDSAYLIIKFANGSYTNASFNWNVETRTDEFEIHGVRGKIVATPLDMETLSVHTLGQIVTYKLSRCEITHLPVVENFVRSINGEETLLIPGEEAIKASQIIDAAYESSGSGQIIELC